MSPEVVHTPIHDLPEFDNHELLVYFHEQRTKLRGYIAIHNTKLGPSTGGTRMYEYPSEIEAVKDVLNLSKAMSYKCALAGVPFGGGKAVIIGNQKSKNKRLLEAYAKIINCFNGKFNTGTDMGMTDKDIDILSKKTKFVPSENGRKEIYTTSEMAALGVFFGIQECLKEVFGSATLKDRKVAIKGLGKLGSKLAGLLYQEGAIVVAADINSAKVKKVLSKYPNVKIVPTQDIHKQNVDVYSPCALGNDITAKIIEELRAKIICGGANNQLSSKELGHSLKKNGILYAPDYVVNAGGLINVVEKTGKRKYNKQNVYNKVKNIKSTLRNIISISRKKGKSTNEIADFLANKIIYGKKG